MELIPQKHAAAIDAMLDEIEADFATQTSGVSNGAGICSEIQDTMSWVHAMLEREESVLSELPSPPAPNGALAQDHMYPPDPPN